jgi:hypothetical protein
MWFGRLGPLFGMHIAIANAFGPLSQEKKIATAMSGVDMT